MPLKNICLQVISVPSTLVNSQFRDGVFFAHYPRRRNYNGRIDHAVKGIFLGDFCDHYIFCLDELAGCGCHYQFLLVVEHRRERVLNMKWSLRRIVVILVLYGIGIAEVYYLPRYGMEWVLGALALTAFLAGNWIRHNWNT